MEAPIVELSVPALKLIQLLRRYTQKRKNQKLYSLWLLH